MKLQIDRAAIRQLEDLPNIGKAGAADLRLLGIHTPAQLIGQDPYRMYEELCRLTKTRHDPCVYDVFISAVRFMEGAPALPWWNYTAERKAYLRAGK
ncbi:MAG: helix-hairpin-helix domain-containing protein [Burkholderiales bacterium]|nr:helix-hairpin-helix domain-containing protein [Burkholderiales bacterium]